MFVNFYEAIEAVGKVHHLDANETAFLARELEHIKSQTYDVLYAANMMRRVLPVSHDVPSGAQSWTYNVWDWRGKARVVSDYGKDFPRVDVFKAKVNAGIVSVGASYGWSVQEMREAAMAATSLDKRKALAARAAIENAIEELAALGTLDGVAIEGMTGFLKSSDVTLFSLPTGGWGTASPENILKDLIAITDKIRTDTKDIFTCNALGVDPVSLTRLLTPYSGTAMGDSIITVFKRIMPDVEVFSWPRLATADAAGTGPRIVAYRRDPIVAGIEISQEYEEMAPQVDQMDFSIACHARFAGVPLYHPKAVLYADNAD